MLAHLLRPRLMQIENGMVSGAWPYNARIDEPLTLDDLAWIYRNEPQARREIKNADKG